MFGIILTLLFSILVCAIFALVVHVYNVYSYWRKRNIDYVKPIFPFGNLSFIMRKSFWDFCFELKTTHPKDYVGIYLGLKPVLLVQTPELARNVLSRDFEYFQNRFSYSSKSDPLGSLNIFTLKGSMWKEMRHELTPMFTAHRLKNVTKLMNKNATELVKRVQRDFIDNGKTVNLKELFIMYTTDTVAHSVFGIRSSVLSGENSPLWIITKHMITWTFRRGLEFCLFLLLPAVAAFFRLTFFTEAASKYVKNMFWTVVTERGITGNSNDQDLVSHLLKLKENLKLPASAGSELADQLMLAQACVFVIGSVESSSTILTYFLHELAYHPDVQDKIYEEINEVLKKNDKDILQYEDFQELKYLSACTYETLRKYPILPHIDRIADKDYKLNDEVTIEAGVPVFVNVVAIHYNEKYYPSPKEWRPERFLNENYYDKQHFTLLSFGEGPRSCIGKRFGLMQVQAAMAQLITNYRLEPAEPYNVPLDPYSIVNTPKSGGTVKFVRR